MSQSPIEFMGETPGHEVPVSEYGGASGLIQPSAEETGLKAGDGMDIGHELTESERSQVMGRRANRALVGSEQTTGVAVDGEHVVDPLTGREVKPDELGEDVTGKKGSETSLRDLLQ